MNHSVPWRNCFLLGCVLIPAACAPATIDRQKLQSTAAEIRSLAAEGQYFLEFVAGGHAFPEYTRTHPEYMVKLAESTLDQLSRAQPGPDVGPSKLEDLQKLAARLAQAANALAAQPTNAALHEEFAAIIRETRQTGFLP